MRLLTARVVKVTAVLLVAGLLAAGCSPMSYVPKGETRGGYSETQLAPHIFDVYYSGNGRYDPERITDFLLLRSAELCAASGFGFFEQRPLLDMSAINTNAILPIGNFMPATMVRSICYSDAGSDAEQRLGAAFIVEQLRGKYQLLP